MAIKPADSFKPTKEVLMDAATREERIDKILTKTFNGTEATIRVEEMGEGWVQNELIRRYRRAGWVVEPCRSYGTGSTSSFSFTPAD